MNLFLHFCTVSERGSSYLDRKKSILDKQGRKKEKKRKEGWNQYWEKILDIQQPPEYSKTIKQRLLLSEPELGRWRRLETVDATQRSWKSASASARPSEDEMWSLSGTRIRESWRGVIIADWKSKHVWLQASSSWVHLCVFTHRDLYAGTGRSLPWCADQGEYPPRLAPLMIVLDFAREFARERGTSAPQSRWHVMPFSLRRLNMGPAVVRGQSVRGSSFLLWWVARHRMAAQLTTGKAFCRDCRWSLSANDWIFFSKSIFFSLCFNLIN